jgi:hypothetical protein
MAQTTPDSRAYHRYPVIYPVIFGGAPFVGEGTVADLSLTGCSIVCNQIVLTDSYVKLSVILPDPTMSLFIELGKVRWVREQTFGVEFIRLPAITRDRLDRVVWEQLTTLLETRTNPTSSSEQPSLHRF